MPPPPASDPPVAASVAASGPKRRATLPYQDRCEPAETSAKSASEPPPDATEDPSDRHRSGTRLTRPCLGDDGRYAIIYAAARPSRASTR